MKRLAIGLGLALSGQACAEETFLLASVSEAKFYGLLVSAPETGCAAMRISVRDKTGLLGRSGTLLPGQVAIVRMGRGFAEGNHLLTVEATGCAAKSVAKRRVVLGKSSPDHGWRVATVQ